MVVVNSEITGTSYFVKPASEGGSDSNTGLSDAQAWATINKVNSHSFQTGENVFFKCGGTWGKPLIIDWFGTADNRVVVGAYYGDGNIGVSGNKPVFDGDNLTVPAAGSYSGLVHVVQSYVTVENIRCVDSGGMGFSAKGTSSANRILNVNFANMESSNTYMHGVRYKYVSGGTISGCDMTRCGRGWQLGYKDTWPAAINTNNSDNIIIKNNIVHENFGEGIGPYYGSDGIIIEDNICYANRSGQIYIDHSKNCIIRRNLCYGTTDSTYWRGDFPAFGIGINDEDRHTILSENNKVYDNLVAYTKLGMWIATRADASVFKDSVIYNNVLVDNRRNFEISGGPWQNSFVRNNISWCISGDCEHINTSSPTPGLTWDHNNWSSAVGTPVSGIDDIIGLPKLSKTTGWRSLTAGSLTGSDFTLQSTSPAIDKGANLGAPYNQGLNSASTWVNNISTLNQNDYGSWEIGAFVYADVPIPDPDPVVCGDGDCDDSTESCVTCPEDCGACPPADICDDVVCNDPKFCQTNPGVCQNIGGVATCTYPNDPAVCDDGDGDPCTGGRCTSFDWGETSSCIADSNRGIKCTSPGPCLFGTGECVSISATEYNCIYPLNHNFCDLDGDECTLDRCVTEDGGLTAFCVAGPDSCGGLVPCGRLADNPFTIGLDESAPCEFCHLVLLLNKGMNFLMEIALIAALLFLVISGLMFIISSGDPERMNLAKTMFKYVIMGFLIIFLAWLMIDFLLSAWGYLDPLGGEWEVVC